jgi:hypothetical protein
MKRIFYHLILCALCILRSPLSASQQETSQTVPADTFSTPHFRITYEPGISIENVRGIADDIEVIYGDFNAKVMLRLPKEIPTVVCVNKS